MKIYAVGRQVTYPYITKCELTPARNFPFAISRWQLGHWNNFAILVSRILVSNIDFFKVAVDGVVEWHIKHEFYWQMSRKSEVVSVW